MSTTFSTGRAADRLGVGVKTLQHWPSQAGAHINWPEHLWQDGTGCLYAAFAVVLRDAVLDCGFHEIRRQLRYKATMRGGRIMIADRFYPSTQICSCCGCLTGAKRREEMHLEQWICRECGAEHERDVNAAINLRRSGRTNVRRHGASTCFLGSTARTVVAPLA